jgi:prepilin-type N-terminal cleavage/methylation domain-containing protein/prepilin-type processing-associated H-X9-DG protein
MSKQKAFTLIELLVVISIIALLLAIMFPVLNRSKAAAKTIKCQANLKQWGVAFSTSIADNPDTLLPGVLIYQWPTVMEPYHSNIDELRLCPVAPEPINPEGQVQLGDTYHAWGNKYLYGSYGLNGWFPKPPLNIVNPAIIEAEQLTKNTIVITADMPILLDCRSSWSIPDCNDAPPDTEDSSASYMAHFAMNRHSNYINGLFYDWSVHKIGIKELWTLKWRKKYKTNGPWTKAGGVLPEDWPEWMRKFKDY